MGRLRRREVDCSFAGLGSFFNVFFRERYRLFARLDRCWDKLVAVHLESIVAGGLRLSTTAGVQVDAIKGNINVWDQ